MFPQESGSIYLASHIQGWSKKREKKERFTAWTLYQSEGSTYLQHCRESRAHQMASSILIKIKEYDISSILINNLYTLWFGSVLRLDLKILM